MLIVSSVAVTLYLGGWHFWWVSAYVSENLPGLYPLVGLFIFAAKVAVLLYIFMWFRWTLPRYRYDQLMDLGWKWLTPAALANIVLTGIVYAVVKDVLGWNFNDPADLTAKIAMALGMFIIATPMVLFIAGYINRSTATYDIAEQRRRQVLARAERQARIAEQKA
jgi:NADH-quinone oxidoreductase subunit H